jgi:hypothetical protein
MYTTLTLHQKVEEEMSIVQIQITVYYMEIEYMLFNGIPVLWTFIHT